MTKETKQKLIKRLYSISLLKNSPQANEYGKGSADVAQLLISILSERENSNKFSTAMEEIKSKAKSADITLGR